MRLDAVNARQLAGRRPSVDLGTSIRNTPADATLRWLKPKLSMFGITRVANITGLDRVGIPVAVAVRPLGRSISTAQGKGISLSAAMVSAMMESIETWHAEHLPPPALTTGPGEVPAARYVTREHLHGGDVTGPAASSGRWHRAVDLMSSSEIYLPEAALDISTLGKRSSLDIVTTTNGLASGNTHLEAICHSAFEIAERDAFARWYELGRDSRARTGIDLDTVDAFNASLIRRFFDAGLKVSVFDLTPCDNAMYPTFAVDVWGPSDFLVSRPYTGRGTHASPIIALTRAITEAAQSRLTMIYGSRDDNFEEDYHLSIERQESSGTAVFLYKDDSQYRRWLDDPVADTKQRLRAQGHREWIVFDHSREEFAVPVVHTFVPGSKDVLL